MITHFRQCILFLAYIKKIHSIPIPFIDILDLDFKNNLCKQLVLPLLHFEIQTAGSLKYTKRSFTVTFFSYFLLTIYAFGRGFEHDYELHILTMSVFRKKKCSVEPHKSPIFMEMKRYNAYALLALGQWFGKYFYGSYFRKVSNDICCCIHS